MRVALLTLCLLCLAVGCQSAEMACVSMPTHTAADLYGNLAIFASGDTDYVWAINLRTGKVAWRHDPKGEVRAAPVIDGDIAYFWRGSTCRCPEHFWYRLFHSSGPRAVDCRTGNVLWRRRETGFCGASPIICGDVVVFTGGDEAYTAYAYEKDSGKRLWSQDDILPLVECAGVLLCLPNQQTQLVGLDPPTGETVWVTAFSNDTFPEFSVAVEEEVVVVALDRVVRRYQARTGKLVWEVTAPKGGVSVAIDGRTCYGVSVRRAAGILGLWLHEYDVATGRLLREGPLPYKTQHGWSELWRETFLHRGVLVVIWDELLAFDIEANELLWKFGLCEIRDVRAVGSSIFVGGWDGDPVLYQLDVRTGKILWSQIGEPLP